jgi:hypothetical protein
MSGELPLVYRPGKGTSLVMLAFGVACLALGVMVIAKASSLSVGELAGSYAALTGPRTSETVAGWGFIVLGLVLAPLSLITLLRGLPKLELAAEGIAATGRFGGVRRWAWADIARIEVKTIASPRAAARGTGIEQLVLVMRDGREVGLVVPGDVGEVKAMMERVRASSLDVRLEQSL